MRSWLVSGFCLQSIPRTLDRRSVEVSKTPTPRKGLRCHWKPGSTRVALETKPATISFGIPQGLHAALAYRDHG
jgi:hypothetical protein